VKPANLQDVRLMQLQSSGALQKDREIALFLHLGAPIPGTGQATIYAGAENQVIHGIDGSNANVLTQRRRSYQHLSHQSHV
jgi:hypothetical protein